VGDDGEASAAQAIAALRWWRDAGVDLAFDEMPRRRFDEEPRNKPTPAISVAAPQPAAPPAAPQAAPFDANALQAAAAATELAAASENLEALRANLERFEGCALKKTATQLVFADGTPGARIMIVGEAPGAEEDRSGKPFVGRAGRLLDRMLASIGLDRADVYIANVVPWRPPGNRTPTPQETQACLPFIRRQIALSGPEILVCMGASATQTLLGAREGITRARGRWFEYHGDDGGKLRALAMFHPAYLLRQPAQKRNAWADMRTLARELRPERSERGTVDAVDHDGSR
jgi:uracil-DNA glycosylase